MSKPDRYGDYDQASSLRAIKSCRYIAQHLSDLQDELILMGGMVPSVLIDPDSLPSDVSTHVGTMDVDLGLVLAHQTIDTLEATKARLVEIGFKPDAKTPEGTCMRFKDTKGHEVIVDLLCGGEIPKDQPSLVVPRIAGHVELAFSDSVTVELRGHAIDENEVAASMNVCGPGAFVLSKASTFANRRENKDAYDLFFVLQYFANGPQSVFSHLAPLLKLDAGRKALKDLKDEFLDFDADGTVAVARFLTNEPNDDIQADVSGAVRSLLNPLGEY
ncbi:hypothetical protein ACFL2H_06880 [Planctomycetota bacterium]